MAEDRRVDVDALEAFTQQVFEKAGVPAGGPKGSGLALIFQCLTNQMANNPLVVPTLRGEAELHNQNSVVTAIDIGFFTDVDAYRAQLDDLVDEIKKLPRADGVDEIFTPGEPEQRTLEDRSQNSIPLPPGTIKKLQSAAKRLNLSLHV